MATIVWTLSVAGVEKPFASWNATKPTLSFRSADEDECSFTMVAPAATPFIACPMSYGQAVVVRRIVDGVPTIMFMGIITDTRAIGSPRLCEWRVKASGPWYQLSRTMFQQSIAQYDGSCVKATKQTTKVVLFADPTTGAAITTGVQISNVVSYAVTQGIVIAAGTLPAFINVPFETARDLTLADVIRRAIQWTPDAVVWFDYSSGVPVLNCQQRASLATTSLDFNAAPAVIKSYDLKTRDDLVPVGVRFNYIGLKVCPSPTVAGCDAPPAGSTEQFMSVTQDDSGVVALWGALVGTVDLAQLSATTTETPPVGLAGQYYLSLITPQYQGSVVTQAQECGTSPLGKVLNLANGNSAWAAMLALVQQVNMNLSTGETEITVGPPEHLSPQNFAMLIQMMRRRGLVANSFTVTRPPGDGGTTNCHAGKDPDGKKLEDKAKGNAAVTADGLGKGADGSQNNFGANLPTKTIHACEDGADTTVTFYTPLP